MSLFLEGNSRPDIAKRLNIARSGVNKWVSSDLEHGLNCLDNKPIQGRPPRLQQPQLKQLSEYIKRMSTELQGGRLTGEAIVQYSNTEFVFTTHLYHVYKVLKKLGLVGLPVALSTQSSHKKAKRFLKVSTGNVPSHLRASAIRSY